MTVGTGDKSPDIANAGAFPSDAKHWAIGDSGAPVYTHEEMLGMFRPQEVSQDFVVNDCVFTEESLLPVCMTEISAKEQELLSGSVNSVSSRRYNGGQHVSSHVGARNSGPQRTNGHASSAGARARPRDGEYGSGRLSTDGLDGDRDIASLWADQSIVRDSVGSFGADGVFRMGGGDDADMLRGPSAYSSRTASPAVNTARAIAAKSSPAPRSATAGDTWAWNELSGAPASAHQRALAERAERLKWVYRDPQGNTQGPFSTANMQEWCSGGYFPADLQVCHEGGAGFEPLSTMIARAGQSQGVFLHAAVAFLAQSVAASSGFGTPATPAALSRVNSSAHLKHAVGDPPGPGAALQPASLDQYAQTSAGVLRSATGSASPASSGPTAKSALNAPSAEAGDAPLLANTELSQAAQLSALLNVQLAVVKAIAERQHSMMALQEQLQQSLAKLMHELTQESSSIHYKAQMEQSAVQPELIYALQQRAQAAEDGLRIEYAQISQMHAAHIAQLETQLDPVIKEIILRSGAGFALEFISQRLQELSTQVSCAPAASVPAPEEVPSQPADASAPTGSAAQPAAADDAPQATTTITTTTTTTADENTVEPKAPEAPEASKETVEAPKEPKTPKKPAAKSKPEADVDAAANKLGRLALEDEKASHKGGSSKKAQKSGSAKKQAQASADKPADTSAKADAAELPKPSPAPWSTPVSTKAKQPKKSILQIQLEEEEAMKRRQKTEEEQRQAAGILNRAGTSYADRVGGGSGAAPRSLAAIMEEQYKQSSGITTNAAPSPSQTAAAGKPSSQRQAQPAQQTSVGAAWGNTAGATSATSNAATAAKQQGAKPAAKAAKSASDFVLPSLDFLQWCQTRLGNLRGIDSSKFIEMLLTFPLEAPESTLEIISEQIYAYSTTLNGRAFADDFAKRRRKDHNCIKGGALKSAPVNWPQLLRSHKAGAGSASTTGYAGAVGPRSSGPASTSTDSSFQVVGKKGR
ncbi:kinesin-like protein, partial [Coemansia sp. RSA 2618]